MLARLQVRTVTCKYQQPFKAPPLHVQKRPNHISSHLFYDPELNYQFRIIKKYCFLNQRNKRRQTEEEEQMEEEKLVQEELEEARRGSCDANQTV